MAARAARRDARPRREAAVFTVMAVAHGAVLLAMLWNLGERRPEAEPRILDIELVRPKHPQTRAPALSQVRASRVTARAVRRPPANPPTALSQPPSPTAPAQAPVLQAGVAAALRRTLGCSEADLLHLSPAERARCDERFAAGGRDPAPLPIGVSPLKQAAFAAGSWRNREPILARTPHNGCVPNLTEREIDVPAIGAISESRVAVGCAVDLDKVGRALHLRR